MIKIYQGFFYQAMVKTTLFLRPLPASGELQLVLELHEGYDPITDFSQIVLLLNAM